MSRKFMFSMFVCIAFFCCVGALGWAAAPKLSGTVKFLMPDEGVQDLENVNAAVQNKLKADGFDFKIEYTFIPYDGYSNRQALAVASGEDYDITWIHVGNLANSVNSGLLAPLDDAITQYGADLSKSTPAHVWKAVTFKGQVYGIPRVVPVAHNDWACSIRGDLRKKYGIPEVTTVAGLEKYMAALKKNEPTMYPMWVENLRELYRAYCPTYIFPEQGVYIDMQDKNLKVKNWNEAEAYRSIVNKVYEWVKLGYMPKDKGLINNDTQTAFVNGKLGSCDANVLWPTEMIDRLTSIVPGAEIEVVFLNPEKPRYIMYSADNLLCSLASSKSVNQAVALLNWVRASQANYDLFTYGVRGVNYDLVGEKLTYKGISANKVFMPPMNWCWNDMRFMRYSEKLTSSYIDLVKTWDVGARVSPLMGLVLDQTPYSSVIAAMATISEQYTSQINAGRLSYDTVKKEMLNGYKRAGIDKLIAEVQKQVDAFVKAGK
jgi:putative aldouronate transport system substrate-binding protein